MCGIFGMFGPEARQTLPAEEIIADLKHRGPDDEGVQQLADGWMAHTRLSIIDLSALGRQPMPNARETAWITYNGEIYNYIELRRELSDYPFRTRTDTEVILAAYERWGDDCLRRLRGMFAFGLWDARRRRLLCATDRFSIKPLYYTWDGRRLMFSSEIKPMARCGVRLQPDAEAMYVYLTFGLLDHGEKTLFEGISQLRPGTSLLFEEGRLSIRRYWDVAPTPESPEENGANPRAVEAAIARTLGFAATAAEGNVRVARVSRSACPAPMGRRRMTGTSAMIRNWVQISPAIAS